MYSFEPTDEQKMLVEAFQRYAINDLRPASHDAEEASELPSALIEKGWELGLLQASIPEAFGGFGDRSAVTGVLAAEELSWGDMAGAMAVLAPGLFALPILLAGSEEQKKAYLPKIAEAEWNPYTAALLEPRFDFDPLALSTRAAPHADGYVISGEKVYVPYAGLAREMIIYADLEGRTQGFIARTDAPGFQIAERQPLMGIHALPIHRVCFDKLKVSQADRLGGPAGHDFTPILDSLRIANAALALGLSRAAFEYARDYAKDREAFGVKIAQKQAVAFMLAEMATEIEAIRLLTWEAAWMQDSGKPEASKYAYLAVTGATDMAMTVTDRAVQILGGHGYIREHPVELWMRNGRGIATLVGLSII